MANSSTVFTNDRAWKIEAKAFKSNLFFYKIIETEVTIYHWEKKPKFFFWGGTMDWVKRA
ncbi:MAG: hypothetical protein M3R02_01490 [Chloroflexota bacterium]|nr:hypothetical protein [Chloroflexota bacterium]